MLLDEKGIFDTSMQRFVRLQKEDISLKKMKKSDII